MPPPSLAGLKSFDTVCDQNIDGITDTCVERWLKYQISSILNSAWLRTKCVLGISIFHFQTEPLPKAEKPGGSVLNDLAAYVPGYARKDWDVRMRRAPTVLSYAENGLTPRDLMLGIRALGASRAFPYDAVMKGKLVEDHVGSEPIILVVGPDDQSVRVFRRRIPGVPEVPEFYRVSPTSATSVLFIDDATGSGWNFQGCALNGKSQGKCLERADVIKDYWFDWRHYNPATTVYRP